MLDVRRIVKTFNPGTPNEVRALQGVDLSIDEGSFVIVIGGNGSGKSTLLNAVAGTFIVDSGSLVLDGTDVTSWPEHRRASMIGRVFQNPFSGTAPSMTIAENLALAARRGHPGPGPSGCTTMCGACPLSFRPGATARQGHDTTVARSQRPCTPNPGRDCDFWNRHTRVNSL